MPIETEQGVSFPVPPLPNIEDRMPDWQAVWVFLQLQRSGSFRACAKRHNMTLNSIRRHIDRLERATGLRVLTRHVDGIRVTPEGETILIVARSMEREAIGLVRAQDANDAEIEGAVRIAVTEGLGAVWLTPRIAEFQRRFPRVRIDLACGMDSADVLRMEADIAVQLTRPEALDVIVRRLGYMHVMPYASRSYIAQHGCPTSIQELASHRLTLQLAHQTSTTENLNRIFHAVPFTGTVAMTTNTSTAHALAIANGVGIGWLPTYVSPLQTGLVAIDCGAEVRLDIWMTFHPDAERIARVSSAIAWLRRSFDARRFPFFAEDRIHPSELPTMKHLAPLEDWMREFAV